MIQHIEHIGIAVKSLDIAIPIYEKLYNTHCYKIEIIEHENVKTAFLKVADIKIELLESTNVEGVIAKFIEKKGEGIHHIAYAVSNLLQAIEYYKQQGFSFINETPKSGADNKLVVFMHPKTTNSTLTELCMEKK